MRPEAIRSKTKSADQSYLLHLLEGLPKAVTADALEALLPWNVKPALQARPHRGLIT